MEGGEARTEDRDVLSDFSVDIRQGQAGEAWEEHQTAALTTSQETLLDTGPGSQVQAHQTIKVRKEVTDISDKAKLQGGAESQLGESWVGEEAGELSQDLLPHHLPPPVLLAV